MIELQLACFDVSSRDAILSRLVKRQPHDVLRSHTGQPQLFLKSGQQLGFSITHARKGKRPISLMAVATGLQIGIDAENWPLVEADPAFLASVASDEDTAILAKLSHIKYDLALFLWVVKEAALKASGDVMVDPRDLAVKMSHHGHISVSSTRSASAPFEEIGVRILQLKPSESDEIVLLAIAAHGNSEMNIAFSEPDWTLQPFVRPFNVG